MSSHDAGARYAKKLVRSQRLIILPWASRRRMLQWWTVGRSPGRPTQRRKMEQRQYVYLALDQLRTPTGYPELMGVSRQVYALNSLL